MTHGGPRGGPLRAKNSNFKNHLLPIQKKEIHNIVCVHVDTCTFISAESKLFVGTPVVAPLGCCRGLNFGHFVVKFYIFCSFFLNAWSDMFLTWQELCSWILVKVFMDIVKMSWDIFIMFLDLICQTLLIPPSLHFHKLLSSPRLKDMCMS